MKAAPPPPPSFRPGRHLEILNNPLHDPYQAHAKLPDPSVCGNCHAVYHAGRWQWGAVPTDAAGTTCPACARIAQQQPAGYVSISATLTHQQRAEIARMVRNLEEREKSEHPLQRVMEISGHSGGMLITTTDPHLARGIGEALEHAWHGRAEYQFSEDEHLLRVRWQR